MAVAKFGPTSKWAGKQITREGDVFVLQACSGISPFAIMENDRLGHLIWVNDGTHVWLASLARNIQQRARGMEVEGLNKAPEDEDHKESRQHAGPKAEVESIGMKVHLEWRWQNDPEGPPSDAASNGGLRLLRPLAATGRRCGIHSREPHAA